MELRVLQYFLAVAREGSISAAAASLHLSQPTLSTQLRQMEAELGRQLLIRGTRGSRRVALTDEGRIVRKRAEEILALVDKMEREVALSDAAIEGDVYLGAGESDTVRLLVRAARRLGARCPRIRYHIASGNSVFVFDQLDKGLIDLGLVYAAVDGAKYESMPLPAQDRMGVLLRRDDPLAAREAVGPADLWPRRLILSRQRDDGQALAAWMQRSLGELQVVATYNLVFNASLLVDEGFGIALCFDKLINTAGSGLCFRPLDPPLPMTPLVVWKKHPVFSRATEQFLAELRALCAPAQPPREEPPCPTASL